MTPDLNAIAVGLLGRGFVVDSIRVTHDTAVSRDAEGNVCEVRIGDVTVVIELRGATMYEMKGIAT